MLELNRLQPMPEIYDRKLFNSLYDRTQNLRNKLAGQIDCRRFGLPHEDILAMFDVKFIFVFTKNHTKPENILLATMLNSLQNFKCRILRSAYTKKFSQNIEHVDDVITLEENLSEEHPINLDTHNYAEQMMDFMRINLSSNAYAILELKLNPPPYIQRKLNISPDANLQKIPDHLILDYFDLGQSPKAYKYLETLKKEIKGAISYAKVHFNKS